MTTTPVAEALVHAADWRVAAPGSGREAAPQTWSRARDQLARAATFWLATTRPDGRPHLMPVLAVTVEDLLYFSAADRSRKARNLAAVPDCVLAAHGTTVDLVVEGRATPVTADSELRRVADAYAATHGWSPQVRDGGLWADGAPTAGPPPYRVHRVRPRTVFGLPTAGDVVPTRWRFAPPEPDGR